MSMLAAVTVAVVGAGIWLRFAVVPVVVAYRVGRLTEKIIEHGRQTASGRQS
jgi:hypothetical protein